MKNPTIKFSHRYNKLEDADGCLIEEAVLFGVYPIALEEECDAFLAWDTGHGVYPLPSRGKYLLLLFQKIGRGSTDCHLFTTLRRYTPDKYDFYVSQRGKTFRVSVEEGA